MNRLRYRIFLFFWLPGLLLGAQDGGFKRGEELFMENKPQEALGFLEAAIVQDPAQVRAYLYLGIIYQQLGRADDAIAIYRKVLPRAGDEAARVAFNLGNVYSRVGNTEYAEEFYTQAINADSAYGPAYLNRANLRIKKGDPAAALTDYDLYLSLEPRSAKRPQIEQLCALIRAEFAAEERRRILAEEEAERERVRAAAEAERQRILAEEAEARRRALLQELSASLQSAAEETRGTSAGSEGVQGYDEEFEME